METAGRRRLLVTAGPTRERVDAVRFLSNRSSGKMGYAIAAAACDMGFEVVLISGPTALAAPDKVELVEVESAAEMASAVKTRFAGCDAVIMAAAVADYRPKTVQEGKLKKSADDLVLTLERTEDILQTLGSLKKPHQTLIGFAAETSDLLNRAESKLRRKNLDWIVANDVSDASIGFGSDYNRVFLLGASGERIELARAAKSELAREMLAIMLKRPGQNSVSCSGSSSGF